MTDGHEHEPESRAETTDGFQPGFLSRPRIAWKAGGKVAYGRQKAAAYFALTNCMTGLPSLSRSCALLPFTFTLCVWPRA